MNTQVPETTITKFSALEIGAQFYTKAGNLYVKVSNEKAKALKVTKPLKAGKVTEFWPGTTVEIIS